MRGSEYPLLPLSLLVLAGALLPSAAQSDVQRILDVEYRQATEEPGAGWSRADFHEVPGTDGVVHIRARTDLTQALASDRPVALEVQALATCEILWDGFSLARQGRVGASPDAEEPGPLYQLLHIPDRLATPGPHLVELRCSTHHRGFDPSAGFWTLRVGAYDELTRDARSGLTFALVSFSGMVLVGLFALFGWAMDRRHRDADLWLSLFCLSAASLAVAESWKRLISYTYDWHLLRLRIITCLAWLVVVTLMVYVVRRFPRDGGRWWVAAVAALCLVPALVFSGWDAKSTVMFFVALPAAAAWCLRAAREGHRGAVPASLGLVLFLGILFWQPWLFVDRYLYVAVDLLLVCLLVGHAREANEIRRQREEARLAAVRLEAELLRRQLQPHFLMNTLTALSEWIEEDPATAVRMIEGLAREMRALVDVSKERVVPLARELELCRSHLEVVSLRRDISYELATTGVDEDGKIPPAVLHTLVENAVTHDRPTSGSVRLTLRQEPHPRGRLLVLEAPWTGDGDSAIGREGTGLRYVRARLREAYGDAARLESGPEDGYWRSRIVLPADGAPERGHA